MGWNRCIPSTAGPRTPGGRLRDGRGLQAPRRRAARIGPGARAWSTTSTWEDRRGGGGRRPGDLDLKFQLANNRAVLGSVSLKVLGDPKAAERYLKEALDLRRERLALEPDSDEAKLGVANALGQLAICRQSLGDPTAAKGLFERELRSARASRSRPARHRDAARARRALREARRALARSSATYPAPGTIYDRCFAIRQALAAENPDHIPNLRDVYRSLATLGELSLVSQNDPAGARDYYRRALDGFRKLDELEPSATLKGDIASGCYFLATALLRLGETAEAIELYRECLDIRRDWSRTRRRRWPDRPHRGDGPMRRARGGRPDRPAADRDATENARSMSRLPAHWRSARCAADAGLNARVHRRDPGGASARGSPTAGKTSSDCASIPTSTRSAATRNFSDCSEELQNPAKPAAAGS